MKIISLGLFFLLLTAGKTEIPGSNSYTIVYFLNTKSSFGLPLSNNDFWNYSDEFDTVIIKGSKINDTIDHHIAGFQNSSERTIHTLIALVRIRNGKPRDTLYTESMFKYWNNGRQYFTDSAKTFHPLLRNFLYSW